MNIAATLLASSGAKSWHGLVAAPDAPASLSGMKLAAIEKKSPAAEAGLKEGDVVTAVGETEVHRALDFQREMLDRKAGEKLDLTVQRDGKPLNLSIVLGEIPDAARTANSRRLGSPGPGICGPCLPPSSSRSSTPATAAAWWWSTFARTARPPSRAFAPATCWWACISGRRFRWTTWPIFSSGPTSTASRP